MSQVTLNVYAEGRWRHASPHASVADRLIPALAADPETLSELLTAYGRYADVEPGECPAGPFEEGVDDQPYDAGIVYLDLEARVVAQQNSAFAVHRSGSVDWHSVEAPTERWLPFDLAHGWLLTQEIAGVHTTCENRRAERSVPPDVRGVIARQLPGFLVQHVTARRPTLVASPKPRRHEFAREIHVEWLSTRRQDLSGLSPRDWMVDERHEHIIRDLANQQHRWSVLRKPPPGISTASSAYRLGGFGVHEFIMQYDLTRHLVNECIARTVVATDRDWDVDAEIRYLGLRQELWPDELLDDDPEDQLTPATVIDQERRRLPLPINSLGHVDDCEWCQSLVHGHIGPGFFHFDGHHMDLEEVFEYGAA